MKKRFFVILPLIFILFSSIAWCDSVYLKPTPMMVGIPDTIDAVNRILWFLTVLFLAILLFNVIITIILALSYKHSLKKYNAQESSTSKTQPSKVAYIIFLVLSVCSFLALLATIIAQRIWNITIS